MAALTPVSIRRSRTATASLQGRYSARGHAAESATGRGAVAPWRTSGMPRRQLDYDSLVHPRRQLNPDFGGFVS